jgi:hypothetical protein
MPNILKAKDIPTWITRDYLKAQFTPYASDSTTIHERFIKGGKIEETYPFVNISDNRVGFIIFDPSTHDAQFALHMMKKTVVTKKLPNGTTLASTLIFGHSFRTDRDLMTDISQQPRPNYRRDSSYEFKGARSGREEPIRRHPSDSRGRSSPVALAKPKPPAIATSNPFDLLKKAK